MVPAPRPQSLECACVCSSCLALCPPMDCSPPGSSVHGILQKRIVDWVAMPSFRGSSQPRDEIHISSSPALASRFFTPSTTNGQITTSATQILLLSQIWIYNLFWGIVETNNHISQPMTDTAREIIFTFKSPKSMNKQVTSADGKTLVSAALG